MARTFSHPSIKDVTIDGILHAMSDPMRRAIINKLMTGDAMSCQESCSGVAPSTISFHHKILRENGLIRSEKKGVEVINLLRKEEVDKKFPGLLDSIMSFHK